MLLQASNHQYRLEKVRKGESEVLQVVLSTCKMDVPPHFPGFTSETKEKILAEIPWFSADAELAAEVSEQDFSFYYVRAGRKFPIFEHADGRLINPEIVGCMTGMLAGIFASGNGTDSTNTAVFTDVVYEDK